MNSTFGDEIATSICSAILRGFYIITVELEHDVGIFNMNYQQRISVSGS